MLSANSKRGPRESSSPAATATESPSPIASSADARLLKKCSGISPMPKRGILLVNLGSPDSPSVPDVRRYLREFLMDPCVIDAPYPIRFAIVHGCVLPFRPRASAEAYAKIWTNQGSPLVAISASL